MEDLLAIVRAHAAPGYEVFGELGRENDSDIWFLGRDLATAKLVALRLREVGQSPDGETESDLSISEELDASVAVGLAGCYKCGAKLRRWIRFCTHCGADLTQGGRIPSTAEEREQLLQEVRESASDVYDVLGEMPWAQGAGIVYFAIEKSSGRLVRLRLSADDEGLDIKETKLQKQEPVRATYLTHFIPRDPQLDEALAKHRKDKAHDRDVVADLRQAIETLIGRVRANPGLHIKVQAGIIALLLIWVVYLLTAG